MPDVTIRRATSDDMTALTELATLFYKTDGYQTDVTKLNSRLEALRHVDTAAIFVAELDGAEVIGFVTVLVTSGLEFGMKAEVESLFVRTKVRGQRIGTSLLEAGCGWAKEQGAEEIFLVIAAQGEPVRQLEQLYLGQGFEPSRRTLMYRSEAPGEG
ncbi:MAG: GNAT family N-acetyltransferase [Pseudomonadota bacterium]